MRAPGRRHHVLEVAGSIPAHLVADRVRGRERGWGVSWSARSHFGTDICSGHRTDDVHDFAYRTADPTSDVEDVGSIPTLSASRRSHMRLGKIHHVDVVADAGAVQCRIVVTEDLRAASGVERGKHHRDQVVDAVVTE